MDVKPGYKQTEVGVIPEDWGVFKLGDLVDYTKGFPFKSSEYQSTGIRIIRVSDTTYDSIKEAPSVFVSETVASQYSNWKLREHDLVVSTVGSKPPMYDSMVGKVILISKSHENSLLNQNAVLMRDRKRRAHIQRLLLDHLRTKRYLTHIEAIYRGNANQASITLKEVFQFGIPIPSDESEQRAIATALSDVDALLGMLDRLIAKKRDLKQAAMQQLLTGQTRLPGYYGEWEVRRFDEIAQLRKSRLNPRRREPQEFCIELEHIEPRTGCLIGHTLTGVGSSLKSVFEKDDVLFGKLRAYLRKYWLATRDGVCSTEVWVLVANRSVLVPRFLFQIIKTDQFIEAASSAYGTHMPRSDWKVVKNYEVHLPSTDEQTAIAAVLTDMDAELAALEQRLAKTRALKQGMMQELLTGKTRLSSPKEARA